MDGGMRQTEKGGSGAGAAGTAGTRRTQGAGADDGDGRRWRARRRRRASLRILSLTTRATLKIPKFKIRAVFGLSGFVWGAHSNKIGSGIS